MPLIEVGGTALHVNDRGQGDVVVLLHAFPLTGAMWDYQVESLADSHRTIAVDLPGFGGSPAPTTPSEQTLDSWADLVSGALAQMGVERYALVGLSMGSYLAFAMMRRNPDPITRLVVAGTRALTDDSDTWQRRTDQQEVLEADGAEGREKLIQDLVERLLLPATREHEAMVDYVRDLMRHSDPSGWIGALQALKNRPDALSTLRAIEVPALVLVGESDRITPLTDGSLVASRIPNSTLVRIPAAGHLSSIENPDAFNAALVEFLGTAPPETPDTGEAGEAGETAGEGADTA